jgi:hypothetical protein
MRKTNLARLLARRPGRSFALCSFAALSQSAITFSSEVETGSREEKRVKR